MNTIRVLLIADPTPMREDVIGAIDQSPDLTLVATAMSPSQALAAIRDTYPDIVLLDETLGDTHTLSLIEDLAIRYPDLAVIALTREGHMDYVRQAMLAGARGFVTTPLSDGELSEVFGQIRRLEMSRQAKHTPHKSDHQSSHNSHHGEVIVIYSPKGGVGKTTLAANLAVALANKPDKRVALVDGNPQFGHLGLILNVHANYSVADLVTRSDDVDVELIEGMMASHTSGVQALLAPGEIERADMFPPQAMSKLLAKMQTIFDWVIVDTWPILTESTLDVLEAADHVLLVIMPDITCLRDTKQFLKLAESLNYPLNKFAIIVNRATEGGLDREAIEEGLKRTVTLEIPQDDPLVTHSLNRGVPVVISHKRSPLSKAIEQLADWVANGSEKRVKPKGLGAKVKRLFGTAPAT